MYDPYWTREQRRAVQVVNALVIQAGVLNFGLKDEQEVVSLGDNLTLNGSPARACLTLTHINDGLVLELLNNHEKVIGSGKFYLLEKPLPEESQKLGTFYHVKSGDLAISPGLEGNGLGTGFVKSADILILEWIKNLEIGSDKRVIASFHARSRSAEEQDRYVEQTQISEFRRGWTANVLAEMGYSNSIPKLVKYLGQKRTSEIGVEVLPEFFVKVFQDSR